MYNLKGFDLGHTEVRAASITTKTIALGKKKKKNQYTTGLTDVSKGDA